MKIGIVSLGLIGGSILKSLYGKGHNLYAVTRNPQTIEAAKKYTKNVSDKFDILKDCEIVFVASPINKTEEILDKLEKYVNKDCIVTDCASVKEFTIKERKYKFIGSHPMAGTENSGFNASNGELFEGAKWVLCPKENILQSDIKKAEEIINLTGAKVIITNSKEHDRAVALISHFPLLMSQALFYCIKDNELAKQLASSGFRDMTRLAMSNEQMALDMYKYNSKNIDFSINKLFKAIDFLKNNGNFDIFNEIKNERSKMYSKDGKNIYITEKSN